MWSELINQQRVTQALQSAIERDRIGHAYLFHGPDGTGKRAYALEFAKTLLCEKKESSACGACNACHKVSRLIHPDVQVMIPYPTDADVEDVTERLQRLAGNPYAAIDYIRRPNLADPTKKTNKQAFYSINRIHEDLRKTISYRPSEGRYKVVLMTDADLLREEGANALLKVLEEPPAQTLFILTTERPDRMLPTIISRCQKIRFEPLSAEDIEAALVAKEQIEPSTAAALARMANGSYSRALELAENPDLGSGRELVVEFLRHTYKGEGERLVDVVGHLAGMSREQLKGTLTLLLSWVRDLVLYSHMGAEAHLVNLDQAESIRNFCQKLPNADLDAMVSLIEEAILLVSRNTSNVLVVTTLSLTLHEAMHGRHTGQLYVPLSDPVISYRQAG